eukprot:353676-Chlamydomonas_euryale.AAC.2
MASCVAHDPAGCSLHCLLRFTQAYPTWVRSLQVTPTLILTLTLKMLSTHQPAHVLSMPRPSANLLSFLPQEGRAHSNVTKGRHARNHLQASLHLTLLRGALWLPQPSLGRVCTCMSVEELASIPADHGDAASGSKDEGCAKGAAGDHLGCTPGIRWGLVHASYKSTPYAKAPIEPCAQSVLQHERRSLCCTVPALMPCDHAKRRQCASVTSVSATPPPTTTTTRDQVAVD